MLRAVELLEVIEASHLLLAEQLEAQRSVLLGQLAEQLRQADGKSAAQLAGELAGLLVQAGVVLSDQQSVQTVIAEYLTVLDGEEAALGDEEKDFLANFLG